MKGKWSCLQLQAGAVVSIAGSSLMSRDCRQAPAAPHLPVHQPSLPGPGCPPCCSHCQRDWRTANSWNMIYFYFLPFNGQGVFQPCVLPGVVLCIETETTTQWWRKGREKWVWAKGIPETPCWWELPSSCSGLGHGSCCQQVNGSITQCWMLQSAEKGVEGGEEVQ